jgi:hypothetical protein
MLKLVSLIIAWSAVGCGTSIYDCSDRAIQVSTRGKLVKSLELSGPGCDNAVVTSDMPLPAADQSTQCGSGFTPYCEYYYIDPHAAGDCNVHIVLDDDEAFNKTATFYFSNDEHCGGYYTRGENSWNLGALLDDAGSG